MFLVVFWVIISDGNATTDPGRKELLEGGFLPGDWTFSSLIINLFLSALGLALIWGQKGIFNKLLLQIDRSCVSVFCPSLSQREKFLKWASGRLPLTWSSQARTLSAGIPELWRDGSLLCTLINSAIPGACPNPHRHWKKPPMHAQALAYKYLGIPPVFNETELSTPDLSTNLERTFILYLRELQKSIEKWPQQLEMGATFSSQYVARGMGLFTGEKYRKAVFYVYSTTSTNRQPCNLGMFIRGPYGTRGRAAIPPFHNLKSIPVVGVLQHQLAAGINQEQKSFLRTISLDFTSLVSGAEEGNSDDIPIKVDMEIDRAKITYIPYNTGMYEISLVCEGEHLQGSPFNVRVLANESQVKEHFDLDSAAEDLVTNEKVIYTKRKILSKIIDCIDETIVVSAGQENVPETDNNAEDNITITAITRQNDEILKTEINCAFLGDIAEESEDSGCKPAKQISEDDSPKIDTDLQNIVNSPNKREVLDLLKPPLQEEQDENNNSNTFSDGNQKIISKVLLELVPVNSRDSTPPSPSPICPEYIVPEELSSRNNFRDLSAPEKRRLFSNRSTFSDLSEDSDDDADSAGGSSLRELSVLNLLDSLKQPDLYALKSVGSLPNMSGGFKATKDYWEIMSSRSSSPVSSVKTENAGVSHQKNKKTGYGAFINRVIKCRSGGNLYLAKSSENISSTKLNKSHKSVNHSKSVDDALDTCGMLSVAERKEILFKSLSRSKSSVVRERKVSFGPELMLEELKVKSVEDFDKQKPPRSNNFRSQFKKAVNFFRNLEQPSKTISKVGKNDLNRRHSFGSSSSDGNKSKKTRHLSLNLSKVSERFSIGNLYDEVEADKRNTLPSCNKNSSVFNSLGSFRKKAYDKSELEIAIKEKLLANKQKEINKKRKSITTMFDFIY